VHGLAHVLDELLNFRTANLGNGQRPRSLSQNRFTNADNLEAHALPGGGSSFTLASTVNDIVQLRS
jgi:hypothetical protein